MEFVRAFDQVISLGVARPDTRFENMLVWC